MTISLIWSKFEEPSRCVIKIRGDKLKQVASIIYLGTILEGSCTSRKEIRSRVEQSRAAFLNMKNLFTKKELNLGLRLWLLQCYVYSVLFYGCESWTLDSTLEKRIESFQLYPCCQILKLLWVQKVTNKGEPNRGEKSSVLLKSLKERKLRYLGLIIRGKTYGTLPSIVKGEI